MFLIAPEFNQMKADKNVKDGLSSLYNKLKVHHHIEHTTGTNNKLTLAPSIFCIVNKKAETVLVGFFRAEAFCFLEIEYTRKYVNLQSISRTLMEYIDSLTKVTEEKIEPDLKVCPATKIDGSNCNSRHQVEVVTLIPRTFPSRQHYWPKRKPIG